MARVAPTFLYAENFIKWLESLANWLEDRELMVDEGRISQFVHEPDCWEETEKVRVSVATALVPEFSSLIISDVKLMHAYQITMSMDDCTLPKYNCTLQKRHWEITEYNEESNQPIQEVDGPGVIGKHPTMQPGEKFTYASWTPLSTKNGYMTGWFTFRNNQVNSLQVKKKTKVKLLNIKGTKQKQLHFRKHERDQMEKLTLDGKLEL
ncbi:putative F-box only protein 3-like [Apostichopus japonicus]|uniref:Putative F-box only protein 3-like n=1 Tax=Stichopus japonicus TaxID=307972 RepID=A0A2G8JXD4_STIJA|nr:putative F-box only protein 3-like [Apostichopus japonicus]